MWGSLPREKTWSIEEKSQGETRLSHSTPTTTCVVTENPEFSGVKYTAQSLIVKFTCRKKHIVATSILSIVSDKKRSVTYKTSVNYLQSRKPDKIRLGIQQQR
jgi:hypothetical protein